MSHIEVHAQWVVEFVELVADTLAHNADMATFTIILNAVFEY